MRTSHLYLIPLLITANLNASHKESSLFLKDHYCSKERIEVGSPDVSWVKRWSEAMDFLQTFLQDECFLWYGQ